MARVTASQELFAETKRGMRERRKWGATVISTSATTALPEVNGGIKDRQQPPSWRWGWSRGPVVLNSAYHGLRSNLALILAGPSESTIRGSRRLRRIRLRGMMPPILCTTSRSHAPQIYPWNWLCALSLRPDEGDDVQLTGDALSNLSVRIAIGVLDGTMRFGMDTTHGLRPDPTRITSPDLPTHALLPHPR